jgi:TonB family protein
MSDLFLHKSVPTPANGLFAWALLMLLAVNNVCGAADSSATADPLAVAEARFLEYYEDGLYSQATVAANQVLQLAREIYGDDSLETSRALINLATVQSQNGEYPAAIQNLETSIRLIENAEGIISTTLLNPLMGLGAAQNAVGEHGRSLQTYERALRINHVDQGLQNADQMSIRDGLTETYLALDELGDANFQQEIQVSIAIREHADDPVNVIPSMYKLADWYRRSGQHELEVVQYQSAVRVIRSNLGKNSTEEIKALRELSTVYTNMNMPATAIRLLNTAYEINADQDTPDPLLAADIYLQMGDFYNLFGSRKEARQNYISAWETLAKQESEVAGEKLADYFSAPIALEGPPPPETYPPNSRTRRLLLNNPAQFYDGYVTAEFDIDADGRVRNILIIESSPENLLDKRVKSALARFRYRPQMTDGIPVQINGERLRHQFKYMPEQTDIDEDEPERLERPGAAT